MVRSFQSVVQVGQEMFEKALGASNVSIGESKPEMTWSRFEVSVMLEHVQAHVAPTDVDRSDEETCQSRHAHVQKIS